MSLAVQEEFVVGGCLVRVYASRIALPGVEGWVGAWAIYLLGQEPGSEPLRIGDTDLQESEELALGMAKAVASSVAASF